MTKMIRSLLVLTAAVSLAGAVAFAETGADIYKSNCQSCHGATGTPSPGMAKAMGVKPNTDPSVKAHTVAQMVAIVKTNAKMKTVAGKLSDAQITEAVNYFRTAK